MTDKPIRLDPPGMAFPGMSQGVRCGQFILVSGQVALAGGKIVGEGDSETQARQCFANIAAVLAEDGSGLSDIVSLRCYLTSADHYAGYGKVKAELVGASAPASSAVIVAGLLVPGLLMEVEAVAWRP